jgi:hypothetical protein
MDEGAKEITDKFVETFGQRAEDATPSCTVDPEQTLGLLDRAHHHAGTPAVDGVG